MALVLPITPVTSDTLEQEPPRVQTGWRMPKTLAWFLGAMAVALAVAGFLGIRAYRRLAAVVDQQLAQGPYTRTVNFYAAPEVVSTGDTMTSDELAATLRRSGYRDTAAHGQPWFQAARGVAGDTVTIFGGDGAGDQTQIRFKQGAIAGITNGKGLESAEVRLRPALVGNISNTGRERRVIIHFGELPPVLVNAVTSAEDKHFFTHGGYDPLRIAKAMYVDARDGRKEQGASTISMQLARNLYLSPEKRWRRKVTELLMTIHLEHALTKQQIFEYYCNQVYLGGYGTFSINGFGEAAHAYFNKDVSRLSLAESAALAGLIQRPSYFNPFRFPERARDRRNIVLRLMRANGYISEADLDAALSEPLILSPGQSEVSDMQFSMDLADAEFQKDFEGQESNGVTNVYTTIDLRLQKAAEKAVAAGMAQVDRLLAKHRNADGTPGKAQAALIALDPHTGEIKAIVGGRDYSISQLDRVFAKRPPGSVFKPFVYAAALNSAVNGAEKVYTPESIVSDVPTTFEFDNQTYSPSNYKQEFHGTVTFRSALAKSMNVAAVKVGQMAGYDNVVALAKEAGMNEDIRATPAVALGAYQVTPFEIARAYTVFANDGEMVEPTAITSIRDDSGEPRYSANRATRRVLDPRVNFLLVDMMQDVLKYGTGAGVRSLGFTLPAAGKTGTSHDGWFAGFTSQLLCIVWVGFDDYSALGLEGAHSALPIWTDFMMEAAHSKVNREARVFPQPDGLVRASIDPTTGLRPTSFCPWVETSYFIEGTQPQELCMIHQDDAVPALPGEGGATGLSYVLPLVPQLPTGVK